MCELFCPQKNNTDDGQYTVHTGVDDLNQFVIIDRWNGLR